MMMFPMNMISNGNIISKTDQTGTTTFTYDIDNRLVQLVTPNSATRNLLLRSFWQKALERSKRCRKHTSSIRMKV